MMDNRRGRVAARQQRWIGWEEGMKKATWAEAERRRGQGRSGEEGKGNQQFSTAEGAG